MISTYAYPTFKLSNAVLLLAKLLLKSESWDHVQKIPTVQKSLPLPYPSWRLYEINAHVTLDLVVLQYTYDECCSIMSPRTLNHTWLSSWQEVVQEEMLLYTTTSNPYRGGSRNLRSGVLLKEYAWSTPKNRG